MPQWINFKELRKNLKFADVLRHHGIEIRTKKPNQHVGACPLPNHSGERKASSFSANLERNIFQCFSCKAKGNVLDFCALMLGLDPKNGEELRQAALTVQEKLFGIVRPDAKQTTDSHSEMKKPTDRLASSKPTEINTPLDFTLKALDARHPYLQERKFTAETIQTFGLGFCKRGFLKDRIAIPLHDPLGRLIGYAGRLVDDKAVTDDNPKYRFPSAREREGTVIEFRKTEFLYNGHRIKGPVENLVIVEGFPALWWLVQHDYRDCVALMGCDCSDKQAELLISLLSPHGRCWVFTDGNDAGERGAAAVFLKVGVQRFVRRVPLGSGRQPTDCTPAELCELLPGGQTNV
jgi:DNA primase